MKVGLNKIVLSYIWDSKYTREKLRWKPDFTPKWITEIGTPKVLLNFGKIIIKALKYKHHLIPSLYS